MKKAKKPYKSLYISFQEVAKILEVKPHVLYYWEKKLPQIKPYIISQRRFYKKEQLDVLFLIKKLLDEGYTLSGIKKILVKKKKLQIPKKEFSKEEIQKIINEVINELKEIYNRL